MGDPHKGTILEGIFNSQEEWDRLCEQDPSLRVYQASVWQHEPGTFVKTYLAEEAITVSMGGEEDDSKALEKQWRDLQKKCWEKYRGFGPVKSSVESKADYVTGAGFGVYSEDLQINAFLKDLFYSHRNKLYRRINGWIVRMQAEGELFLLLAFDEKGTATIRTLEPDRIGEGEETGLILNPDDITETLLYNYTSNGEKELIPDILCVHDPNGYAKKIKSLEEAPDQAQLKNSKGGTGFSKLGGYRRFILHWKNLTGIDEYARDISHLVTTIEAINLYWNALKWELDHKKAQCAYTIVVKFEDSPAGRIGWAVWKKMSDEEKKATGLITALTPGSKVFCPPGMSVEIKSPQLQRLSGENQDLINLAGAGARTPQDLWQGQSAGATYASLRSSRAPLEIEIANLQKKTENFLRYELLRACFKAANLLGEFPESFKTEWVDFVEGEQVFKQIDIEPCELVRFSWPHIRLIERMQEEANARLGSKHAGLSGIGVSDEQIAGDLGVSDLPRQRMIQALERRKYGVWPPSGPEADRAAEDEYRKKGLESGDKGNEE